MLGTNEKDIVGLAFPDRFEETGYQLDKAACLLELFILLEERNDIFEPWMKGIGGFDLVGNRLSSPIGGFGFGGLLQLATINCRNILNFCLVGQRLE